jgi:hypothetical protein
MWALKEMEYKKVIELSPRDRLKYLVKRIADEELIWSLKNKDGWILSEKDGKELIPIWPHKLFAESCAKGDWNECTASSIPLDEWIDRWIPGMKKDNRLLIVFPTEKGDKSIMISPDDFLKNLLNELQNY